MTYLSLLHHSIPHTAKSFSDFCDSQHIAPPNYNFHSDRRGRRTAWSCSVSVGDQKFSARYWYDGQYFETAREDAADEALLRLQRNLTASNLHQYTLQASKAGSFALHPSIGTHLVQNTQGITETASSSSSVVSRKEETFDSDFPARLQIFFDPETGASYTLTPRTSLHSDGGDPESEIMLPHGEKHAQEPVTVSEGHEEY